jgi:hypothetical protein
MLSRRIGQDSCLTCRHFLPRTTEQIGFNLSKFKKPHLIQPFRCTYHCGNSANKVMCETIGWICQDYDYSLEAEHFEETNIIKPNGDIADDLLQFT